jgi:hypothetical protein
MVSGSAWAYSQRLRLSGSWAEPARESIEVNAPSDGW